MKAQITLFDLVTCFSKTLDLVSPAVMHHHKRVAYIALCIAEELKLSGAEIKQIVLALLHDIGALSLQEKMNMLHFEADFTNKDLLQHCLLGQNLLKNYVFFSEAAPLVGTHHIYWQEQSFYNQNEKVLIGGQIIHLSDRIAISMDMHSEILSQVSGIMDRIVAQSGKMFCPELVRIFKKLALKECFWLDIISLQNFVIGESFKSDLIKLDLNNLMSIANLFCQIIDFWSPFTATHSKVVAAVAESLARFMGFSFPDCQRMRIAGYLHDLGKLAVPKEILEKPGNLTQAEFNIIRSHPFYGYRTLEMVRGLELINTWGSLHHEQLNGNGYPFHLQAEELTLGSRIMAIADIFTALTEGPSLP